MRTTVQRVGAAGRRSGARSGGEEDRVAKKALFWLVVAFAIYSIIATPVTAADAVRSAGEGLRAVAQALIEFFDALTP